MLGLMLPKSAHTGPFTTFLAEQTEYKTINMDQWTGYYRFTQEVGAVWQCSVICALCRPYMTASLAQVDAACSNFDEAQAWPLLLDNYVEWRREH